jgi:hypothetical protein
LLLQPGGEVQNLPSLQLAATDPGIWRWFHQLVAAIQEESGQT